MKIKKRIAYIATPIEFGGAEKVSLNFLRNVDRDQFQVCPILFIRPWEKKNVFLQEMNKKNYRVHQVPVATKPRNEGRDHFRLIRCFKIIFFILVKGRFNLVHTHGYFADIITIPIANLLRIPIISTCHGFIANDRKLKRYNLIDRIVLRFSDKIIAVSKEIKNELLKSGIKESHIKVVLNAVQTDIDNNVLAQDRDKKRQLLNINEKDFVLGYIGRLSKEKGIQYLIEAAVILNESDIPIKVLIIGEGPEKRESEYLVKQRGLEGKIFFTGFQSNVNKWIPAMDVFVLPSLIEGTPMALLEAMACRIPIVASAVGGVPQIIDSGKEGILVSPAKPEEIATGIKTLYNDASLRENFVRAAQKKVKSNFDIKEWTKKIEAEYLKVIKKNI
jgi:glycosyltransferase involved in cell wall biosynthesis